MSEPEPDRMPVSPNPFEPAAGSRRSNHVSTIAMSTGPRTEYLVGEGLLPQVADLRARLGGFLASGQALTLDLSGLGAVDVSFVQLMVSASLTAERAGQVLELTGWSPGLRVAFERAGVDVDPAAGRITLN